MPVAARISLERVRSDPEDVRQRDLHALVAREIDAY